MRKLINALADLLASDAAVLRLSPECTAQLCLHGVLRGEHGWAS